MKKLAFILIAVGVLFSCNSDDNSNANQELIGNWKLIEILADPGDGSGSFYPVESDKTIAFHQDGTITSNGSLCDMSLETNTPTSGTYSVVDFTFKSNDCSDPEYEYHFQQNGSIIIIDYPCIEPCKAKYQKQ